MNGHRGQRNANQGASNAPKKQEPWDRGLQTLLALIVSLNLIPHTLILPPWITACCATALTWKLLTLLRGYARPPNWLLSVATVVFTIGVFLSFRTLVGQEAAGALLALLASLKLLETNRYRDAMMITFVSFFLLMTHLLNSQSLLSTLFMALDVLLITMLMFHLHKRDRRNSARSFRPVMKTLAMTLPVWIFLFLVFPRFSTGFWRAQNNVASAGTAFSDQLDPGSVSHLVDSDELAFRVDFGSEGLKMSPESIYWRGTILTKTAGLSWQKDNQIPGPEHRTALAMPGSNPPHATSYQIFLEPGYHHWIFALDFPVDLTANDPYLARAIEKRPGFSYEFSHDNAARVVYSGVSNMIPVAQILSAEEYQFYLRRPIFVTPKVKELVNTLAAGAKTPQEAARAILKWYDAKNFHYTHSPGAIPQNQDQLEYFLFHLRQGFCEHYAGSFATLMRLMGHPARVVLGFQGGKYNDFGHYFLVRSLEAHAWTEIWINEGSNPLLGRWTRVDPTEFIAPLRLQLGGDYNRLDATTLAGGLTTDELRQNLDGGIFRLHLKFAMAWDAIQMRWNSFLLLYDYDYQRELLDKLGFKSASRWIFFIWMTIGIAVFLGVLYWSVRKQARREDPVLINWREFCRRMSRVGITRRQNEGPRDFTERVLSTLTDLTPETRNNIERITAQFIDLRYGRIAPTQQRQVVRSFGQSVRRFSIKLISRSASSKASINSK